MGAIKGITIEQINNLKKMASMYHKVRADFQELFSIYKKLESDYKELKRHIPTWDERVQQRQDKERLAQLEDAFEKLPEETREQILPTKSKERKTEHGFEL